MTTADTVKSALLPGIGRPMRIGPRHAVILQVDGALSAVNGLGWLMEQRTGATGRRVAELVEVAREEGWSPLELGRARLSCLRPRRAEVQALGRAYLAAMAPGAVDAAHRIRRTGASLELAGEIAAESLLPIAVALGVVPHALHAPQLRFDVLGAYVGYDVGGRLAAPPAGGAAGRDESDRIVVGLSMPAELMTRPADRFVRFTGFVAHEGPANGPVVNSFAELAEHLVA